MHVIKFNSLSFTGPSSWEEVSKDNLLNLAICTVTPSAYTRQFLVMTLFKVPQRLFCRLKECQAIQLEHLVDWFFERNTITNWLLPVIKIGKIRLYGPQNSLADLSAEQFMHAEAAFERWCSTGNKEYLDTLFAVLYTRKSFFDLKRRAFNPDHVEKAEKRASRVKLYVKRAVAINYAGCRNLIIDKHPYIWLKSDPNTETPSVTVKPISYTNWVSMIKNVAGDKFGPLQDTFKTNVWIVLDELNRNAKQYQEMEARFK